MEFTESQPDYGAPSASEPTVAGITERVFARIVDYIIQSMISFPVGFVLGFTIGFAVAAGGTLDIGTQTPQEQLLSNLVIFTLSTLFGPIPFAVFVWLYGATPAKLLFGQAVIMEDGERPTLIAALIREYSYYIDSLVFGIVGIIVMNNSPRNQRLGDKWGKTLVVKRRTLSDDQKGESSQFLLACAFFLLFIVMFALLGVGLSFI